MRRTSATEILGTYMNSCEYIYMHRCMLVNACMLGVCPPMFKYVFWHVVYEYLDKWINTDEHTSLCI